MRLTWQAIKLDNLKNQDAPVSRAHLQEKSSREQLGRLGVGQHLADYLLGPNGGGDAHPVSTRIPQKFYSHQRLAAAADQPRCRCRTYGPNYPPDLLSFSSVFAVISRSVAHTPRRGLALMEIQQSS
jgi:hypothetical protein